MHRRRFLLEMTAGATGAALGASFMACDRPRNPNTSRDATGEPPVANNADRMADRIADRMADRMAWWRDARFGMFLHFGLYSTLGGEWKGKRAGSHEWIRNNFKIPHEQYIELVHQFNPTGFDADAWVSAAKDAGQQYVVLTTKHHEGFSLWDSAVTTYDVMATPFKRDIVREVADACRRHGLRIGWYYSIMDWYHPDYLPRRDWETRDATGADFTRYVTFMKAQLRELLTRYGDIAILWFDGQWERTWNHALGLSLYDFCRSIAPDVIINNRVDAGEPENAKTDLTYRTAGDFRTPEQEVPATGIPGVDWESCVTMNDNWGWSKFDHHFKSVPALVGLLVETASKGGNLLLNVGPMGDGRFPQESTDGLKGVGAWMRRNGTAIYASHATPFKTAPVRITAQHRRLNLFMEQWKPGPLVLPGLATLPQRAYLLEDPALEVTFAPTEAGVSLTIPERAPASLCPVVALDFADTPVVR